MFHLLHLFIESADVCTQSDPTPASFFLEEPHLSDLHQITVSDETKHAARTERRLRQFGVEHCVRFKPRCEALRFSSPPPNVECSLFFYTVVSHVRMSPVFGLLSGAYLLCEQTGEQAHYLNYTPQQQKLHAFNRSIAGSFERGMHRKNSSELAVDANSGAPAPRAMESAIKPVLSPELRREVKVQTEL